MEVVHFYTKEKQHEALRKVWTSIYVDVVTEHALSRACCGMQHDGPSQPNTLTKYAKMGVSICSF